MTGRRAGGRRGLTVAELLVAVVLGGFLLTSAASLVSVLARSVAQSTARWDHLEAIRTVWVTLERELRPGILGRDWSLGPGGRLELRAFRGFARICGPGAEPGTFPVAWTGERLPVVGRDSLVVLGEDGGWRPADLTQWSPISTGDEDVLGCASDDGERVGWMSWTGGGPHPPVVARVFERGNYSFHEGAFRYERGNTGRQPLTLPVFASETEFVALPDGLEVVLHLRAAPGSAGGPSTSFPLRYRFLPAGAPGG